MIGVVTSGVISVTVLSGVPALELKVNLSGVVTAGGISVKVLLGVPVLEPKADVTI